MIKIINLYDAKETNFSHNGLAVLNDTIRAEVQEQLNNLYELELEYPICCDDSKWEYLVEDNIIKVPTPNGKQLFRIYKTVKNMHSITCYARHIFYDLAYNFLEDVRPTELSGNEALKYILSNTQYPNNFKCYSDIKEKNTAYYIRKNPVQALLGDDKNSFLNRWGGEINRDNFNIFISSPKQMDNGVVIAYGKNLIAIEEDVDKSEICTRLMVTGLTDKDQIVILPEKYIDSPHISDYPFPKIRHMHFGDIKIDAENNVTLEDVQKQLREKAHELFYKEHVDIPKFNYRIDFVELRKTEEYKNYKCLETVSLGDIVTVKHKKLKIDIKQKVVSYKYDCINNKYINIELNSFKENLADDFRDFQNSIEDIKEDLKENKNELITILEKTESGIKAVVERVNENKAELKIAEKRITTNVEDKIEGCNSRLEETASSLKTEINDTKNSLSTKMEETEKSIKLEAEDKIKGCNAKIEENAGLICLVVRNGKVDGDALIGAINLSDKKIDMSALNINLNGYVTFRNLERGETTIDGSCINTRTIDADEIGSRITTVSKFIHFDGHNGLGGIGLNRENDLWLYSNGDVIIDASRMRFANGDRVATREWVDERLEKFKEVLDFLNNK